MAANKFTDKHKFVEGFLFEEHLRNFLYKDIYKKTGLSFDEYLNRPRYEIVIMNKVIQSFDSEKNKINQNLITNLSNNANNAKKETTPK